MTPPIVSAPVRADHAARDAMVMDWVFARAPVHGLNPASLAPASSDASFRRYFRIAGQSGAAAGTGTASFIVMDAPPGLEDLQPFLHARRVFAASGVRVPIVFDADLDGGFLLLEDFGSTHYLASLNAESADRLYGAALDALVALQTHSAHTNERPAFPLYDATLLRRELELFREWYCIRHLRANLSADQHAVLDQCFALLIANNLAQTQVPVHRDYHSRNLMVLPEMMPNASIGIGTSDPSHGPGILDFQDAVIGPITYDLVSLLRDAYLMWDEERVIDWAIRYWERARRAGVPVNPEFGEFYRDFEWMGLQRHLKVLGIFARLSHRDGKHDYLADLPVVLNYVRKCAVRYQGFGGLLRLLDALGTRS